MSTKSKKKVRPRKQLISEPSIQIPIDEDLDDVITVLTSQCHILDPRLFGWMEKESDYDWGCRIIKCMSGHMPESYIYATLKTKRILTEENMAYLRKYEIQEWNNATEEYSLLSDSNTNLINSALNLLSKEPICPDLSKEELEAIFEIRNFHPILIDKCKKTFVSSHFRESVMNGILAILQEIKEITGRIDLDGSDLVDNVFSPEKPILSTSLYELGDDTEQRGVHLLFKGFVLAIRNQFMHRDIYLGNPFITLEYLSFFTFLLQILDGMILNEEKIKNAN